VQLLPNIVCFFSFQLRALVISVPSTRRVESTNHHQHRTAHAWINVTMI